ncbi:MAG: prepilin-type N-terminal cleavage/methylation domain-containing protein [bacterium]|nr:prepilin-type N-terminal cleavage/methylation domain-containing protein [bacterium]
MNRKGFTLIELIVVIVIIGILAAIAIPRFMGAQDRARIGAAEADVTLMRQALGLYEIDYSTYNATGGPTTDYANFVAAIKGPDGKPYMSLPDTTNFTDFSFTPLGDSSFTITVKAKDVAKTTVTGTPTKTYH